MHYVDYERLPIEEFSENGGSIPHNYEMSFEIRQGAVVCLSGLLKSRAEQR